MSNIDKLVVENFKAFYGTNTIDLEGKHLLIYGENGSGKSSIYWALYTLLQSTTKAEEDIAKYFDRASEENLLNIFSIVDDTFVKISTSDEPDTFHKISRTGYELEGATARPYSYLEALNASSDFISHRLLINFYNFRNSKEINLWEVFVRDIFPFITTVNEGSTVTLSQLYKDILETLPFYNFVAAGGRNTFKVRQSNHNQRQNCIRKINLLNESVNNELANINGLVNAFYTNNFKDDDDDNIEISLAYSLRLSFGDIFQTERRGLINYIFPSKRYVTLNNPFIKLKIRKQKEDLTWIDISRPQSYFNEALLTQIALSIRFALTQQRMGSLEGQFLALDDLLVSLDMSNRNKVIDIILNVFAPHYKIYLFTHEKSFYDFCVFKIEQRKEKQGWKIMEIHSGDTNTDKPVIIQSGLNHYDKAVKYFEAKDYTTCSLYLRKELEKLVIERLPEEYTKTIDGQFHNLEHYWKLFIERYKKLNKEISPTIKEYFKQSKLLILNPAAHHNLNLPVYKIELERAFTLVENIYDNYPIPKLDIILCKSMRLKFTHPNENYTFEFELENDFATNSIDTGNEVTNSKCKILKWQYNNIDSWDFTNRVIKPYDVENNPIVHDLLKVIKTLTSITYLNIDLDMFLNNTLVLSNVSLKKIFEDYNIVIAYNIFNKKLELHLIN